jgi:HD-GYP domain-containing protein (c-di-GMP phosphodiesterase class II)
LNPKTSVNAINIIKNSYDKIHKSKDLDEYLIKNIAREIVEYVRNCRDKGVNLISTDAIDDYIIGHSINVAIITAFLGNRMNYP